MDIKFLEQFIKQAKTTSLKTSEYPRELFNLKMKVSFGQGSLARVPWIALHTSDMPVSNGYYPVYLYYKEQNILILSYGISETYEPETSWTEAILGSKKKIADFIDNPYRYGESFIHQYYKPVEIDDSIVFYREDNVIGTDQLAEELKDIVTKFKECLNLELKDETSSISSGLFYMEQQLEDFIIENWANTEFGKKYDLIYEEGELKSQQYKTDIGRIDILAKDKTNGSYVVIELKRNQTSDDTVGQIARYMGWVKEHLEDELVKGVIIAGKYDEKLFYAQRTLKNIEVFLYEVDFKLKEYRRT